jgi:hypothetical protein
MPTSEARVQANQKNAAHSTGPKTEAGKERSRQNSLKHGLTGAGVVLIEADAAEVERRTLKFADELMAVGEVGQAVVRRAALNSVRMERGADQQAASLTQRVRQVEADFVAPEGVDEAEAAQLRAEAVRIAMFDPSKEATLARQYEAAAERGFFRAIKQLRQMELQVEELLKANDDDATHNEMMGSFFEARQAALESEDEVEAIYAKLNIPRPRGPFKSAQSTATSREVDVPITIGRPR